MSAMACVAALLRAVNVGGTGKLAMKDLSRLCESCGFTDVRTYIQSGNVVFKTRLGIEKAGMVLGKALLGHVGAKVDVMMRDGRELRDVLAHNPFPDAQPAKVAVFFAPAVLEPAEYEGLIGEAGEEVVVRGRELFVHYPEGQGHSKLKLPKALRAATARNINTVTKLAEMCGD